MAHILDTSLFLNNNANPVTTNYTCGTGATLLVLGIGIVGTGSLLGSPPSYAGRYFTNINVSANTGGEAGCQLWAITSPSTGTAYPISIPNTGTAKVLNIFASSYDASPGYTSIFDTSSRISGTFANPSSNVSFSDVGSVAVQMISTGAQAVLNICYPGFFVNKRADMGANQAGSQYYFPLDTANVSMGFIHVSEDTGLITGVWKQTASAPLAPFLSTPADNAISVSIESTLIWNAANAGALASSYGLQVCSSSSFITNDISEANIGSTSYALNSSLNYNTDYWWRVNAKNISGISDFTTARKFTTSSATDILKVLGISYSDINKINDIILENINKINGIT